MRERIRRLAREHPRTVTGLRWAMGLGLLALTLAWVDLAQIVTPLRRADLGWLSAALLLSIPTTGLMAWRWSFTARRMEVPLALGEAWREYYLSLLLNQVLPGGVAGDVVRVARQADEERRPLGRVARAVVVERSVGQVVLWLLLLANAAWWGVGDLLIAVSATLALVLVVGLLAWGLGRRSEWVATVRRELRAAVVDAGALVVQLVGSLGSILALVATIYCCAAAIDSAMTPEQALLVAPWMLAATVLPLSVGGWGVRELSAMALFELAGLPAAEGAASSVLFGAVSLVAATPGLVPLVRRRREAVA